MPEVNGKWEPGPNDSHVDPKSGEIKGGLGKDEPREKLAASIDKRAARIRAEIEAEGNALTERIAAAEAKQRELDERERIIAERERLADVGAGRAPASAPRVDERRDAADADDADDGRDEGHDDDDGPA